MLNELYQLNMQPHKRNAMHDVTKEHQSQRMAKTPYGTYIQCVISAYIFYSPWARITSICLPSPSMTPDALQASCSDTRVDLVRIFYTQCIRGVVR
jgi:hypothetical protein